MRSLWFALVATTFSCGSDQPALSNAKVLTCPGPDDLPFRTMSSGFQMASNGTLAKNDTRVKDEASDTLGNPGGPFANVFLDQTASPTTTPVDYSGVKARTGSNQGIETTPLVGEYVSAWYYDMTAGWKQLGRTQTGDDGSYDLPATGYTAPNGSAVYAMLEADGTCAISYDLLLGSGSKVIVADIDGTLTLSDQEFLDQLADESYVPKQMGAASTMMQAWAGKGYPLVYLTARPHEYRAETAQWLTTQSFPQGATITGGETSSTDPQPYKTVWLQRMVNSFGWNIVAAYGNASTDIAAYEAVNVPKSEIFIVGPLAGSDGTAPIENMDFTDHIQNYIDQQPNNN